MSEEAKIPEDYLGIYEIKKVDILATMGLPSGAYTVEAMLPEEAFRRDMNPESVYFMIKDATPAPRGEAFLELLRGGKSE